MDVQLTDGVIRLRPFYETDVDRLFEAVVESKEALSPYLFWCHENYSREETASWIALQTSQPEMPEEYNFSVVDDATDALLGGAGISHISYVNRTANLGYWVRSGVEGKGIATRAASLVLGFCFGQLDLMRVEIDVQTDNPKSARVAEKLGAFREGILRNKIFVNGKSRDAFCFSLLPGEWKR